MIKKTTWAVYIELINNGVYEVVFEHPKKKDRRVYIIYPVYGRIVDSCSYQAFRKYRKHLHSLPGSECSRMH